MGKFQSRLQKITQKSQPLFHRHPPHTHTLTGAPLECTVYGLNNQLHSSLPHLGSLCPGSLQKQLRFMLKNLSFLVAVSTSKENSLNGSNVYSVRGFNCTAGRQSPTLDPTPGSYSHVSLSCCPMKSSDSSPITALASASCCRMLSGPYPSIAGNFLSAFPLTPHFLPAQQNVPPPFPWFLFLSTHLINQLQLNY